LITIPNTGHSVLGADLTGCSDRALKQFMTGKRVQTTCRRGHGRIRPDGPIPGSLNALRPAAASGKQGRTVAAASVTVFDVLEQSADSLLVNPLGLIRGGGLRGGRFFETANSIRLEKVEFIPGVLVSGDVAEGGAARLAVAGPRAAAGHVVIRHGRVTGVLGGKRVNGRIRSLSQPARAAAAAVLPRLGR